ncbi:MAG: flagellar motor protein MotB [Bryobacteraceae bacterium]
MARRKRPPEAENHERWLVSYADFVTLLFALFVMMFANSEMNKDKAKAMSEGVKQAFEEGKMPAVLAGILGGTRQFKGKGNASVRGPEGREMGGAAKSTTGQMAELLPSLKYLSAQLEKEIKAGQMQISMEPRGLVITLHEAAFFPSGGDTVNVSSYSSLAKVAEAVCRLPNPVRLEGHTDSIPIRTARFRSNWELSAARSIAMLELFTTRFNVPRERLAVAGYAETAPVDSNETEEGRARNRRVDIVILNELGLRSEPHASGSAGDPPKGQAATMK